MSQTVGTDTGACGNNSRLNSVQYIIANFSSFNLNRKIEIKTLGRPTPELKLTQSCSKKKGRSFIRHFKQSIYQRNKWICGCDVTNSLFCFPCLLFFNTSIDKSWSRIGVTDLNHLQYKISRHEISKPHLHACTEFAFLGKVDTGKEVRCTYCLKLAEHNEIVRKNRHILRRLINGVKFCGMHELALPCHDESNDPLNCGIFKQLINYSAELDKVLKEHFRNSAVFRGNLKKIQNEILDCMLTVCKREILEEVESANFLSIQCDETTDVSNNFEMAIILRYVKDHTIREHFWTFLRGFHEEINKLVSSIQQEIDPMIKDNTIKLIAQAYDGMNLSSRSLETVHVKMREKYPYAYFVHCYAHELHVIIQKASSRNSQVRVFFNDFSRLSKFFSCSNKNDISDQIVKVRLPHFASTRWNFDTKTINSVYKNREKLRLCLQEISEKGEQTIMTREAITLVKILEDNQFLFWLTFFNKVFPRVDILYDHFQSRQMNDIKMQKEISNFEKSMQSIRQETDAVEQELITRSTGECKQLCVTYRTSLIAKEVCDVIVTHLKGRFSYRGHLEANYLATNSLYTNFDKTFPNEILNNVTKLYPMLSKEILKSELEVVYSRIDFSQIENVTNTLKLILRNELESTFPELVKLLKIIMTTPMNTAEPERCFPTLKRLKTFLRNSRTNWRLNALAMLSINRDFVHDISNFDRKVLDLFVELKNRRMDFLLKD